MLQIGAGRFAFKPAMRVFGAGVVDVQYREPHHGIPDGQALLSSQSRWQLGSIWKHYSKGRGRLEEERCNGSSGA